MKFIEIFIYLSIYIGLFAISFYVLSMISAKKKVVPEYKFEELPKASILIAMFNEEKTIKKTIESALNLKYPKGKLEIIVIDDGSKDKSLSIAKKFEGTKKGIKVKVIHQENTGKGGALNAGLKIAKGEIIITMDADTYAEKNSLSAMARFFKKPEVMCVTPSMVPYKPKGIIQRIQHAEYLLGIFLRSAFASVNAEHIAPGAFSAYRKFFFDKYGGYEVGNITEDLELTFRIQYHGYEIENCPEALVYTVAPTKFKELLIQRRRWYSGLIENAFKYRKMFSRKYGDLGTFVLPIAWISIFLSVFFLFYMLIRGISDIISEVSFLISINFYFGSYLEFNKYLLEKVFFTYLTDPVIWFFLLFIGLMIFYARYATSKIGKTGSLSISLFIFLILYPIFFGFWWVMTLVYNLFNRKIVWR
ncbi:MAG: glycosyltransferase [Nanoarchaeota archaeon]|nr:glycosyltransferase [Nanoarchaeota archaeon]